MTAIPLIYTGETAHEAETQAVNALREAPLETLARILTQDTIPVAGGYDAPSVYGLLPAEKTRILQSSRWHVAFFPERKREPYIYASVWVEPENNPGKPYVDEAYSLKIYSFILVSKKDREGTYRAQWLISLDTTGYAREGIAGAGLTSEAKLGRDSRAEALYAQRKQHAEQYAAFQWEKRWDGRAYSAEQDIQNNYWTVSPGNKEASE